MLFRSWYTNRVNTSNKPFYTVIGNHDVGQSHIRSISATPEEVTQKFIIPTRGKIGLPNLDKPYYRVDWNSYGVSLIVLCNYCGPENLDSSGNFIWPRYRLYYGQEQIDWLLNELMSIPSGNRLVILQHWVDFPEGFYANNFKDMYYYNTDSRIHGTDTDPFTEGILPDIINAWKTGGKINKSYQPVSNPEIAPALNVVWDFSLRGTGIFVCYLNGHHHRDSTGYCLNYPDQKVITFCSSSQDTWQNVGSDLARAHGTKAQDAITVFCVDTQRDAINLVRVGSNVTLDMRERTMITIPY